MRIQPIKFRQWFIAAAVLIGLGLIVDHYSADSLFAGKTAVVTLLTPTADAQVNSDLPPVPAPNPDGTKSLSNAPNAIDPNNNFMQTLAVCQPKLTQLALQSPEAYYARLKQDVGVRKTDIEIENYHLRMADGSELRVQVLPEDNTNSQSRKEFRVFKLDAQGYPERLTLQTGDTLDRVLASGDLIRKEWRERTELNDGSVFVVETHNQNIYEFQHMGSANTFSCQGKSCVCQ